MVARNNSKLKMGATVFATMALVGFAQDVLAVETEYSGTFCISSKVTVLESSPEMTIYIAEGTGIQTPDSGFQPWANATMRCTDYARVSGGKVNSKGACRWVDASGDSFVGEYLNVPGEPGKWTFLAGSGKWKGIQGSGTYKTVARGKPAEQGTGQLCNAHSGKYTLP
jgi:hypothetical protein